ALFGGLEAYARATVARVPSWYRAAERIAAREPVGAVFFGSSRTQAAVVPRAFDAALAARGAPRARSLNLGRGYTTDAEHYLGLRRLLSANPDHVRGMVVFAELGTTVPWPSRWDAHAWAFEQAPEVLVDVMGFRDLPSFWRSRGLGLEMRAHVTLQALLRPFASITRRVRLRRQLGRTFVPALARNDPGPEPQLGADLEGPGPASSIRTDTEAVARAREQAGEVAAQQLKYQAPIRDWAGTIPEDIVHLVQAHGGRVVFFQVPVHQMFADGYRTPIRQADTAAFAEQARRWGVCVVRPAFPVGDEDFPDVWHLHAARAPAFSEALAQAWLDECR
ncbi:MAG TPA: hypothetical protein VFQ51_17855, partial [Vicinamibacteria bacterium]|nr:hypothetical protein [Vicinamibacteria bacterium]